jgi:hypothetical protein
MTLNMVVPTRGSLDGMEGVFMAVIMTKYRSAQKVLKPRISTSGLHWSGKSAGTGRYAEWQPGLSHVQSGDTPVARKMAVPFR